MKIIGKLIYSAAKSVKSTNQAVPRMFARTIMQKGNGQARTIVKGFTGANLDANHFRQIEFDRFFNLRNIVAGFTGTKGQKLRRFGQPINRTRWFPNFNIPKMQRHVVYDIQPQKLQIKGFNNTVETSAQIVTPKASPATIPTKDKLFANERTVVQGFNKQSNVPIIKPIDLSNSTPRTVIKGFLG